MTIADLLIIVAEVVAVAIGFAILAHVLASPLQFREAEMNRHVQAARLRVASSRASIKCAGRG